MEGTVKFFNRKKGFGFISGDDGEDYFVHFTNLGKGVFLRDNDRVSFTPGKGERGKKAENVQLLQKASERTDVSAAPSEKAGKQDDSEEAEEGYDDASEDDSEESFEEEEKE